MAPSRVRRRCIHISPQDQRAGVCGQSIVGPRTRLCAHQCRVCFHIRALSGVLVELGQCFPRAAGVAIMVLFTGLNLRGVGEAGSVEIVLVSFKLDVLVDLSGWGPASWNPPMLSCGVPESGLGAAALLATLGTVTTLVETASLDFYSHFPSFAGWHSISEQEFESSQDWVRCLLPPLRLRFFSA